MSKRQSIGELVRERDGVSREERVSEWLSFTQGYSFKLCLRY